MKQNNEKAFSGWKTMKKYYDKIGRIVSVLKDPVTRKYTILAKRYNKDGKAISFFAMSFPTREDCFEELKRFPRETRKSLIKSKL